MKNLVVCSDGTGNTFSKRRSNVSSLIRCLDLSHPKVQMAFYDQGIGTNPHLASRAEDYKKRAGTRADGLELLHPPTAPWWMPSCVATLAGLLSGYGLKQNVREIVEKLYQYYEPGDRIYLFGFSRGAFTVRAVAGLLYHCGLPLKVGHYPRWFEKAFWFYEHVMDRNDEGLASFRNRYSRNVDIEFMGLWDTVKAYGVVTPKSLVHLRHNPIVKTVRHALALHETRTWFAHTTWGSMREPLEGVPVEPDERYQKQSVLEVWFHGCHSDVGGGDKEWATARIPFRWMLNEAFESDLGLNDRGRALLRPPETRRSRRLVRHESFNFGYWLSGVIPRCVLFNDHRPAKRKISWLHAREQRYPAKPPWPEKVVYLHQSAIDSWMHAPAEIVDAQPIGALRCKLRSGECRQLILDEAYRMFDRIRQAKQISAIGGFVKRDPTPLIRQRTLQERLTAFEQEVGAASTEYPELETLFRETLALARQALLATTGEDLLALFERLAAPARSPSA